MMMSVCMRHVFKMREEAKHVAVFVKESTTALKPPCCVLMMYRSSSSRPPGLYCLSSLPAGSQPFPSLYCSTGKRESHRKLHDENDAIWWLKNLLLCSACQCVSECFPDFQITTGLRVLSADSHCQLTF